MKIKDKQKIVIGILVVLILIGGIFALFFKYFEAASIVSQVAVKNPIQTKAVDLAKLSEEYVAKSTQILNDYFSGVENNPNLADFSAQAQQKLLALNLPAEFKDKHLSEVLLLGQIAEAAQNGQAAEAAKKISELKNLAEK